MAKIFELVDGDHQTLKVNLFEVALHFPCCVPFFHGQQQFSIMNSQMVIGRAKPIFGDMQVLHPKFTLVENAKAICKTDFTLADGLYFGTGQNHPRIVFVFDEIIMICRSVPNFAHGKIKEEVKLPPLKILFSEINF